MKVDYSLYLVTCETLELNDLLNVVEQAVKGGVTIIQLREKQASTLRFIQRARRVQAVLEGTGVPLIINDRLDVALAINADGVHLGQSDMPVDLARKLLGQDKILGLSIETKSQLKRVNTLPIDYIGLSAIFPTKSKSDLVNYWGVDGLKLALNYSQKPVVAIGGINESNLAQIYQTGVDGVAVVSAICHEKNVFLATQNLKQLLKNSIRR